MAEKIREGEEHLRLAKRSLKTSLIKWRPDYDSAADEFSKAATCFRVGRSIEKAKDCLIRASNCYKENKSLFHAAKSLDQTVILCKDSGNPREIQKLAEDACSLYQQHGSLDAGASVLDKAAKILEHNHPEVALQLFQHAADVVMIEDGSRQAAEYISKAARILVKLRMFDQAADALRREIGCQQLNEAFQAIGRLTVALVLVQLARGDCVAAEKAFKEWGNYCEAPEVHTVEMLLQAFDDEDSDAARAALNSPFIRHMDIEYSQLARSLPMPQGMSNPNVFGLNQKLGLAKDKTDLC
ncbi:gamma-soluble NSF attachment protein-like [Arctopsyche grandis]|uniref:gamma-soluble NSF attachment protein-like n=1 Tax=Arctopsyche grandis TaxID=121162 RepID=UPI00406D6444